MDKQQKQLLAVLQTGFPLTAYPYRDIGSACALTEQEVMTQLSIWQATGLIRRIGGSFQAARLGYCSTLCAAQVPVSKVELLADLLQAEPGVTHNYLRSHRYNMWFTLTAPSRQQSVTIVDKLQRRSGVVIVNLPARRIFKLQAVFGTEPEAAILQDHSAGAIQIYGRTAIEQEIVRRLQGNLPLVPCPFDQLAAQQGMTTERLLTEVKMLQQQGIMRRFGAILAHRQAGFTMNIMTAWQVPADMVRIVGHYMGTFAEITHCYERETAADWPYNVFAMLQGRSVARCAAVLRALQQVCSGLPYELLFSGRELKKTSMRYFE